MKTQRVSVTKHTPGPWCASDTQPNEDQSYDIVAVKTGAHVARTEALNCQNPEIEQVANARLIAAAPELLAALRSLLEWADADNLCTTRMEAIKASVAAIAKAVR